MQDKSNYNNPNNPIISQGLQDFINSMVQEIVLRGESFEKNQKWLKKYSENEGLNYEKLEQNFEDLFELIGDYQKMQLPSLKKVITKQAEICFVNFDILENLPSKETTFSTKIDSPGITQFIPNFKTIKIGTQIWMAENLNVENFRNSVPIQEAKTREEWILARKNKQPAWCYYDNNPENGKKYGKLYNWHAVSDSNGLPPLGWHIPGDMEWTILTDHLGGFDVGGKLKEQGTSHWKSHNLGTTNESGFSALPGGCRCESGSFDDIANLGFWWTSTENNSYHAWERLIYSAYNSVNRSNSNKGCGYSIRCIMDTPKS